VHRLAPVLALVVAGLTAVVTAPAVAQEGEPPPTSLPSTTTSSSLPVTTVTGPTTSTTADPDDPVGGDDAPEEDVPVVDVTVPPRAGDPAVTDEQASRLIRRELHVAEADVVGAEVGYAQAEAAVMTLEGDLQRLRRRIDRLSVEKRRAVYRHEQARQMFEERAADALIRGELSDLAIVMTSDDVNDAGRRTALLSSVMDADDRAVRDYLAAKRSLAGSLRESAEDLAKKTRELKDARVILEDARLARDLARVNLAVFAAGSEIVIHGFVFPVDEPHSFGDSFGAPRMTGTKYEHAHQGTDIMAPAGTRLLACERGIITKMGTDVLGGIKLWLKGESGTYYYYAHLSAFEPDITDGTLVEAGDVIGYVGDTGNAKGGPAHLHYQIHPDGGPAVNPYPLLAVVDGLKRLAQDD
jgi:murein DD-endopeptidase MepM/ murein hydrolase activator NlpD